jgi:4'-phosphopantetheinyl transferase
MLRVAVARVGPSSKAGASTASRELLRGLLQAATGVHASAWQVSAPRHGAPVVAVTTGGLAGPVHVSLSHRLGWVAAAVSDAPVGIDVESERPPRSEPTERALLMLSPIELSAWTALPPSARERALLTAWTAKEAWFKADPPGLAPWDFRRIAVRACPPDDPATNVRTWTASPVNVALCGADVQALASAHCDGLVASSASSWHVHRVFSAD